MTKKLTRYGECEGSGATDGARPDGARLGVPLGMFPRDPGEGEKYLCYEKAIEGGREG